MTVLENKLNRREHRKTSLSLSTIRSHVGGQSFTNKNSYPRT